MGFRLLKASCVMIALSVSVLANVGAAFRLGFLYQDGLGVEGDKAEALKWYRRAAEAGVAAAAHWYAEAEKQGNVKAMINLGLLYEQGRGVPQNFQTALDRYQRAAGQGDGRAIFLVARLHETGRGVPQDDVITIEWYRKSAAAGEWPSAYRLSKHASGSVLDFALVKEFLQSNGRSARFHHALNLRYS